LRKLIQQVMLNVFGNCIRNQSLNLRSNKSPITYPLERFPKVKAWSADRSRASELQHLQAGYADARAKTNGAKKHPPLTLPGFSNRCRLPPR